jgi:protein O-mannosyl-transferase
MTNEFIRKYSHMVAICLIVILTSAMFFPSLWNNFVNYDDTGLLENHGWRGWGLNNILWWFTNFIKGDFKPLGWASYAADYTFWGLNPLGYHLTNILLHVLNALCLYFLLLILTGEKTAPWKICIAVLFFSLHPLRVESVSWITARKDVLCGLFYLISLLAYLRYVQSLKGQYHLRTKITWWYYGFSLLCALFAGLSKPIAVSLPVVLLLFDIYFFKRYQVHPKKVICEKIPYLFCAIILIPLAVIGQKKMSAITSYSQMGLESRFILSVKSYIFYIWKTIYPFDLHSVYSYGNPPFNKSIFEDSFFLVMLIMTTVSCFYLVRKGINWPLLSWAWYLLILFPVSGFFRTGIVSVADRFTYLPSIGFSIAIAFTLSTMKKKVIPIIRLLCYLILLGISLLTIKQIHYWKDSSALWNRTLLFDSRSHLAHNNLGIVLFNRGEIHKALEHYKEALQIKPDYVQAYTNLGMALDSLGRISEAIFSYKEALKINPSNEIILCNLASTLCNQGESEEAIKYYSRALQTNPESIEAHLGISEVLIHQDKLDEAIAHMYFAHQLEPDNYQVRNNLGVILARQGKYGEAINYFKKLLYKTPESECVDIYNNLGMIYLKQGVIEDAIEYFNKALEIDPDFPEAHYNLGIILSEQGKIEKATRHLEIFQRFRPDHVGVAQILKYFRSRAGSDRSNYQEK